VKRNGTKRYICETKRTETNQNNNVPKPWKKLCFEPKKVDEKSSNGHNFPLTESNCKYLSFLERSCYEEFEKNVTKKFLGQIMNRVTSC
jgi:hypothetical protein